MMASSIGLVVTAGITNTFVQMSQRIRQIEAKQQREIFYNYIRSHFKDPENCKATLNAKGGFASGAKTYYADAGDSTKDLDGDGTDDHEWTIPKLLVPDGSDADTDPDVHLDFYPSDQTKKDSLEKRFWEKWGIEKFDSIMFIHDKANGSHLRVHIWNIAPGGMPYPAGPYMIPLTVETDPATSPDKGEKITFCSSEKTEGAEKTRRERYFDECGGTDINNYFRSHLRGGGLVSHTASVQPDAFVTWNAIVCGTATIMSSPPTGKNILYDNAVVKGNVRLWTDVKLKGDAKVYGSGLFGIVNVSDNAEIFGSTNVYSANISGDTRISGNSNIGTLPSAGFSGRHGGIISGGVIISSDISKAEILGGEISHAVIRGGSSTPPRMRTIKIEDNVVIKGKPGARITITGVGTIKSGAVICKSMTIPSSGEISGTHGTCPP